jgi:signal transduction histidine kinase/DNA-binding LacI/PurR family transcriptional regulator/DNA-binding response OmpR family regulator
MAPGDQDKRPTIGILAGWQFYRTATNLSYLAPLFRGASRAAQNLGSNLLLGCGIGPSASPADPYRPAWPFTSSEHDFIPVGPWNTDGLIIVIPLHSRERSEYVQNLIADEYPILFIGSGENGPTIMIDNSAGILEAIRHLVDHGHKQIAFIAGTQDDLEGDTGDRLRAYQSACRLYGLDQNPALVAYGRHVFDGGSLAMQQIIASGANFTAVLASNDESALGAMQILEKSGHRIPEDVAIIGFDNRLEGAGHVPALSSIHVPLFEIGYQAVERMLQHIQGNKELVGTVKVDTHLVVRQSCGCGYAEYTPSKTRSIYDSQLLERDEWRDRLPGIIAMTILNQAHSLTEQECLTLCQQLVDTFSQAIQSGGRVEFENTLREALQRTLTGDDDAHIWQDAISILDRWVIEGLADSQSSVSLAHTLLDDARVMISTQMQQQHRQYVAAERWTYSRLSLLTARLLTALDESQIYEILTKHLLDMEIHLSMLGLFEAEGDDPVAWCTLRNVIQPAQAQLHFPTRDFPPAGLLDPGNPFILTLIPLIDQSGQVGFMVFGAEYFDLYGAIVQQVGGALNTARLYRQATEGRRLAEEANRIKSRFLSTISHELRTPLNLIMGLSGILIEEIYEGRFPLPDPDQRDVERIYAYAQHLGGLIGDVLDLATNDAGQLRLNMEFVDLGESLRIVAESGSQLTADKGLAWRAALPESGPWVFGDRTRLRQIVLNLVNNAIKFTNRGEVCLSLSEDDGFVTVSVHDTGLGIPLEDQITIFDEFRRSDRSISLGYAGLGLGLAICKMLVERQSGTIKVISTGVEGEGSTFSFTLPTVPPPTPLAEKRVIKLTGEQTALLLMARSSTNKRLQELLSRHGLRVQQALLEQPSSWQSYLVQDPPDIIVLDISESSDTGWSTLEAVKASQVGRGIPILFYSSSPDGEAILNLDYLTKPIEPSELSQALDRVGLIADVEHPVRTFLVVDDEPETLDLHARIVQSQSSSNRVLKALNGLEALDILQKDTVDLVLLDLQMPQMDGFSVLEAMHKSDSTREIPVIVVTGRSLTEVGLTQNRSKT